MSESLSLRCHPLAYQAVERAQFNDPEQSAEFQQFLSCCGPGMSLFDIGASFGIFSLACAGLGGKALAVDPSHIATKMISRHIKLNGFSNSVQVLEAAVGDGNGTIEMLSAGIYSDGYLRFAPGREKRELTIVPLTTVDNLVMRFGSPSHLKVDVEGCEAAVLRGAEQLLRRSAPIIFLELHNDMVRASGGDVEFSIDMLQMLNYRVFSVHGNQLGRDEVLRPPICRILAKPL